MDRRLNRRLVALATAYALALGALLPVLTIIWPPAMAGISPVICGGGDAGSAPEGGAPARQQHPLCPGGAACAMTGCGGTALPGPILNGAPVAWVGIGPALSWHGGERLPAFRTGSSKLARGPPIA